MRTLFNTKIREMPRSTRLLFVVIATLMTVAIGLILWAVVSSHEWKGLVLNLGTEIIGAVLIYLLLGQLVQRTQRAEEETNALKAREKQMKEDLIAQLGSRVRDVSVAAAEELKRYGWTKDGSLEGVSLESVDLRGADFSGADLRKARLYCANLSGLDFSKANLSGADMVRADLGKADLSEANLSGANLSYADLSNADLSGADLSGADLEGANLSGAAFEFDMREVYPPDSELFRDELEEFMGRPIIDAEERDFFLTAIFDENTVLPDGTKWTPDTDMERFTGPKAE